MARFIKTQNSFANGEVAPEFWARDDIAGLSRLENMDVLAGGAISRRAGLRHVQTLRSNARLIPFSVSENENYMLAVADGVMYIFQNDQEVFECLTPWPISALDQIQYAQRYGTMIFVHPDYRPCVLKKNGDIFALSDFQFAVNESDLTSLMPFVKFDDTDGITITVTTNAAGNNTATFTTNSDFWTPNHVNDRLELLGKQWKIIEYVSPTVVYAVTGGTYSVPTTSISDWREAAFGGYRGWPRSITFHQDRLVFGGSRGYPGGLWMSQVGRHNNFSFGTGLDDEAIFVSLLSGQRQQIVTVISSDNLQILTSVGEWAISSRPMTPSSIDIKQHTTIGSMISHYLPPQRIEGKTVFMAATQNDIRELALDTLGETYNATDLCMLSKHMIRSPIDMAYNDALRQLYVVMHDGEMAVLNHNSGLNISAWGRYKTQGAFQSVAALDGQTYVVVLRNGVYNVEVFDGATMIDAEQYGFSYRASALPMRASGHNVKNLRVRKITARVLDTKSLFINNGRVVLPNKTYDDASRGFSGDVSVNILGTQHACMNASWTIHSSDALPATILSVTMCGDYIV